MANDTWMDGSDNWNTPGDWSGGLPGSTSNVVIDQGDPQVTASFGTVASLTDGANLTFIDAGASTVTGAVTNSGTIDLDPYTDDGGSSLSIGGALDNSGTLSIGPGNNTLSAASTVDASSVANLIGTTLGTIDLYGSSTAEATLDISSAANLGAANTLYGNVNLSGDALVEFASGEITTIAARSELSLAGPDAFVADASKTTSNSALTGLATVSGALYLYNGASVKTGALSNSGTISLDQDTNDGGASLTIGGALTNDGTVSIGPANNTLSAASTVDASSVTNYVGTTFGTINLYGSSTAEATLDDAASAGLGAANTLIGNVNLSGDSLLEFASGQIATIDSNSELSLSGPNAFVADAGSLSSNSALNGLATVNGGLYLYNGASVATGALTNNGTVSLDQDTGDGGASLTVDGALTNTGTLSIGPANDTLSAETTVSVKSIANFKNTTFGTINIYGNDSSTLAQPIPAALDIFGAAGFGVAGTVEGNVNVSYDGQIVFGSGEITTIAANSELSLTDPDAVIADAGSLGSNSALTGLKTIDGGLYLYNGASVKTSGALTNSGIIRLDQDTGDGGSSLTVDGALTNTGTLSIGPGNDTLSAATTVSATSVTNYKSTTYGTIDVNGNDSSDIPQPIPAALDISGAAGFGKTGTIEGNVNVAYDGQIVFGSGQITTIAAKSELSLTDPDAVIADAGSLGSNSALTGLKIIDGGLYLYSGATVTTTGALTNSGTISLDQYTDDGGSSLKVGGKLTNTGTIQIGPGNDTLSAAASVSATGIANFKGAAYGTIDVYGNDSAALPLPVPAALDISGSAGFGSGSTLEGNVNVAYDGQIVFAKGGIKTIAANSELSLTDPDAVIADQSDTTSNSALKSLSTIDGSLYLYNGATVTTSGNLTNSGTISLDQYTDDGGSSLSIKDVLTNDGTLSLGPGNDTLSEADAIKAASLINGGTINVYGNYGNSIDANLNIAGAVANNGSINFSDDYDKIAGAVSGTGSFGLSNGANLDFASSVASGQTVTFGGGAADLLTLNAGSSFNGTIEDFFTAGDGVDLTNFAYATTTFQYTQTGVDSASWTLTNGANKAVINFAGEPYTRSDFLIGKANGSAGSEIKFI